MGCHRARWRAGRELGWGRFGGDGRAGWVVQGSAPRGAGERCPLGAAFIDPKQG